MPSNQPWWRQPLPASAHSAEAWLAPWEEPEAFARLARAFAEPSLYLLGLGLSVAPDAGDLQRLVGHDSRLHLWRAPRTWRGGRPAPLWAHSTYTGLHRVMVWAPDEITAQPDIWAPTWVEGILALAHAVLAHEPAAEHVFVDLPRTPPMWQEAALVEAGFDPFETDPDQAADREAYGLDRAVYEQLSGR